MAALYLTIWLSLALFAAAEIGRGRAGPEARWPRWTFVSGLALALVHTALAFAIVHGWSHQAAVNHTAAQTRAVFGVPFGAGVYVNYLFYLVWAADAAWWRRARTAAMTGALRAFYLVIIVNATVMFAAGWRRILGVGIVCALAWSWTRGSRP